MSFLSYPNLRKLSTRKFSLIDIIVFLSYYLFFFFLSLSLMDLFRKEFVVLGSAAGFLLFLVFFRGKIEFKKYYLYFFAFAPVLLFGVLLIKGHFSGMGMDYWLPWAREIVRQGGMPAFVDSVGFASRVPLLPLFYAGMFSFLGFGTWVIVILPFFFASATAFLIYLWLSEKGVKTGYKIFAVLLLLTSPLFLSAGMQPLQEPFLLFFATAFFYYLEKSQKGSYFLGVFLSFVLAVASKILGLILFLPLVWFFLKNRSFIKKSHCCLLFLAFPLALWWLRNYIIYGNPVLLYLNEIFKGRYYDVISATDRISGSIHTFWVSSDPLLGQSVLARAAEIPASLVLFFFPLIILSFYGFWKKRKLQYAALFLILLSAIFFLEPAVTDSFVRYLMLFLGLLIVYAVLGLEEIKSRLFLSFLFFINLWWLFFSEFRSAQVRSLAPIEGALNGFGLISQFVYDHNWIIALVLAVFFFFLISPRRTAAKYLILLSACLYLVKATEFQLGSWLNVWLPILGLVLLILTWNFLSKLKKKIFIGLTAGYIVVSLILNGWGLAAVYFSTHNGFVFPRIDELCGSWLELTDRIKEREKGNADFYIGTSRVTCIPWYTDFKTVLFEGQDFQVVTDLQYKNSLSPSEMHRLFKVSRIKYVARHRPRVEPELEPIFDKIKSRPDLFEPIFQKEGRILWLVY